MPTCSAVRSIRHIPIRLGQQLDDPVLPHRLGSVVKVGIVDASVSQRLFVHVHRYSPALKEMEQASVNVRDAVGRRAQKPARCCRSGSTMSTRSRGVECPPNHLPVLSDSTPSPSNRRTTV